MKEKSIIPGVVVLIAVAIFLVQIWKDIRIFDAIALLLALFTGKKIAYIVHDKELLSSRFGTNSRNSRGSIFLKPFGFMADISLLIGMILLLGWTVFTILLGFLPRAVFDSILFGHVRYSLILSVIGLILGSYLFFRARVSTNQKLLSSWAKRAASPSKMAEKMLGVAAQTEEIMKSMPEKGLHIANGAMGMADEIIRKR